MHVGGAWKKRTVNKKMSGNGGGLENFHLNIEGHVVYYKEHICYLNNHCVFKNIILVCFKIIVHLEE